MSTTITKGCKKVIIVANLDELNNFNEEYSQFKKKLGDVRGKNFLESGNNNNYQRRENNYQLPDEGYNKYSNENYLRKKKY